MSATRTSRVEGTEPSVIVPDATGDVLHPWGEAELVGRLHGTKRRRRAVLKRGATEDVLEWVEKVRSWIPAWRRAVTAVKTEAAVSDPTSLEHALEAASRFWSDAGHGPTDATWSPYRAYDEAHDRDAAAARLARLHGPPKGFRKRDKDSELYEHLVSTALVGEHIEHLIINLQEAAASWPSWQKPKPDEDAAAATLHETHRKSGVTRRVRAAASADADATLAALQRALQHALFLTFVRDAAQALPGERRSVFDYCRGWGLDKKEKEGIWEWLVHDSPRLGGRHVELAIDQAHRCVYRKPCTLWQKTYTLTAPLWGGALAFGLVAGVFGLLHRAGIAEWPEDWIVKMVVLFVFVAAGGGLHLASRSLSNIRFDDPLKVYTAAEGWDWLRLRWIAILRIYIPIAVVVGLLWGAGNIPTSFDEIGTAVLAGFTADSIFRTSLSAMQAQSSASQSG